MSQMSVQIIAAIVVEIEKCVSLHLYHPDIDKMNVDFERNSRKINIKQC